MQKVSHFENREFRIFLRKILEYIKLFYSHPKKDVAVVETNDELVGTGWKAYRILSE